MANGNFRISKFAFGDDEINYEKYKWEEPSSGSAYYDLEIAKHQFLLAIGYKGVISIML